MLSSSRRSIFAALLVAGLLPQHAHAWGIKVTGSSPLSPSAASRAEVELPGGVVVDHVDSDAGPRLLPSHGFARESWRPSRRGGQHQRSARAQPKQPNGELDHAARQGRRGQPVLETEHAAAAEVVISPAHLVLVQVYDGDGLSRQPRPERQEI